MRTPRLSAWLTVGLLGVMAGAAVAALPCAATQRATWSDSETVKLCGMVLPNGAETSAWFEWGTNAAYGRVTQAQAMGSGIGVFLVAGGLKRA